MFLFLEWNTEKDISRRYYSWAACVFHICLKVLARLVTCNARLLAVFFNDFHPSYLRKHWTLTFSKWRTFTLWANRDCFGQVMLSIWAGVIYLCSQPSFWKENLLVICENLVKIICQFCKILRWPFKRAQNHINILLAINHSSSLTYFSFHFTRWLLILFVSQRHEIWMSVWKVYLTI